MATLHETSEIDGPFATDDPVRRLVEFYVANGYKVVEHDGEAAALDDAQPLPASADQVRLERGKSGNGWWTSNMTELFTYVRLQRHDEQVHIAYEVETTGQMLNDIEQTFWRREAQWARRHVNADDDEPPRDLRDEEAKRAKQQTSSLVSVGLWGAVLAFLVLSSLILLGII